MVSKPMPYFTLELNLGLPGWHWKCHRADQLINPLKRSHRAIGSSYNLNEWDKKSTSSWLALPFLRLASRSHIYFGGHFHPPFSRWRWGWRWWTSSTKKVAGWALIDVSYVGTLDICQIVISEGQPTRLSMSTTLICNISLPDKRSCSDRHEIHVEETKVGCVFFVLHVIESVELQKGYFGRIHRLFPHKLKPARKCCNPVQRRGPLDFKRSQIDLFQKRRRGRTNSSSSFISGEISLIILFLIFLLSPHQINGIQGIPTYPLDLGACLQIVPLNWNRWIAAWTRTPWSTSSDLSVPCFVAHIPETVQVNNEWNEWLTNERRNPLENGSLFRRTTVLMTFICVLVPLTMNEQWTDLQLFVLWTGREIPSVFSDLASFLKCNTPYPAHLDRVVIVHHFELISQRIIDLINDPELIRNSRGPSSSTSSSMPDLILRAPADEMPLDSISLSSISHSH